MTYKEALEKIATVNAMDYEYQAWAREALAKQEQDEPVGEAYLCDKCSTPFDGDWECPSCGHNTSTKEPVYTTPQQIQQALMPSRTCLAPMFLRHHQKFQQNQELSGHIFYRQQTNRYQRLLLRSVVLFSCVLLLEFGFNCSSKIPLCR